MVECHPEEAHLGELIGAGTTPAPDGQLWVCTACGKRARTRYGFTETNKSTALDYGYDESCMMHAVLCYEAKEDGQYVPVTLVRESTR